MSRLPLFYHIFPRPLPYTPTLALQERIHEIQLAARQLASQNHLDVLLLLQHRPVYTAGRRQNESDLNDEKERLVKSGADWVLTTRGGETTYHGPGQIVGYPQFDLDRMGISTRDYICRLEKSLRRLLLTHNNTPHYPSEHTGLFLSPTQKLGSIGVQVRHRLTSHGFAVNITREPLAWFDQVIACGLPDVKAACIEDVTGSQVTIADQQQALVRIFGEIFERETAPLDPTTEIGQAVTALEAEADSLGRWFTVPKN